jgi:hypothetical protein
MKKDPQCPEKEKEIGKRYYILFSFFDLQQWFADQKLKNLFTFRI